MNLIAFIQLHHLHTLSYVVLFFGTFIDAILDIFAGVFLVLRHALNIYIVGLVLMGGVLAEQLFWYGLGRLLAKSERVIKWTAKAVSRFDRHFHDKPFRTLFITKFVYGTHRPTLMRAGMLKMPIKKFMRSAFPGAIIWLAIIALLSAALSASYQLLKLYLRDAGLVILGLVIILFLFQYLASRSLEKEL